MQESSPKPIIKDQVIFQNIMKLTDGLFLEVCNRVAQDYPEIEHNDMIIDNT